MNTPLSTIYNDYNGNITDANIKTGAAIDFSKVSGGSSTALGAWAAFTPTFTLTGGGSWGNGVLTGAYVQIGKTVTFWAKAVLGSTTNFSGLTAITLNYPVTASANVLAALNWPIGNTYMQKPGTAINMGRAYGNATNINVWVEAASGTYVSPADITSAIPFAWAASSLLVVSGTYEAA